MHFTLCLSKVVDDWLYVLQLHQEHFSTVEAIQKQLDDLQCNYSLSNEEISKLTTEVSLLYEEKSTLNEKLVHLNEQLSRVNGEAGRLNAEATRSSEEAALMNEKLLVLKRELLQAKDMYSNLLSCMNDKDILLQIKETEIDDLKTKVSSLELQKEKLLFLLKKKTLCIEDLKHKVELLEKDIKDESLQQSKISNIIENFRSELKKVKSEAMLSRKVYEKQLEELNMQLLTGVNKFALEKNKNDSLKNEILRYV